MYLHLTASVAIASLLGLVCNSVCGDKSRSRSAFGADGDLAVVLATSDSHATAARSGDGKNKSGILLSGGLSVVYEDANHDGNVDIVISECTTNGSGSSASKRRSVRGNGAGAQRNDTAIEDMETDAVDVDQDGDVDLVVTDGAVL